MKSKMRRNFSGSFVAEQLGGGNWRLSQAAPRPIAVYLHGADGAAAQALATLEPGELSLEWQARCALLTMTRDGSVHSVQAVSAIVHEPLEGLYECLPLASFDAKAQRFWRRVFRVVRIPGGRLLLGLFARSRRGG
jgi:hypothetical protein